MYNSASAQQVKNKLLAISPAGKNLQQCDRIKKL